MTLHVVPQRSAFGGDGSGLLSLLLLGLGVRVTCCIVSHMPF